MAKTPVNANWLANSGVPYADQDNQDGLRPVIPPSSGDLPVYADRTKLVTADAVGGGDGSEGSPWTLDEAMANAVAGDLVGIEAGVYVGTRPAANPSSDLYIPSFYPANAGTDVDNKLIFVAENQASKTVTPSQWTDIRSGGTVQDGQAGPAFGIRDSNWTEWVGIYSNETDTNNKGVHDSGVALLRKSTGAEVENSAIRGCRIIGEVITTYNDNHSGIRVQNTLNCELTDNYVADFNTNTGGATNNSGVTTYDCHELLIEYNEFENNGDNYLLKGQDNRGITTRFNISIDPVSEHFRLGAIKATDGGVRNLIYQNVAVGSAASIVFFAASTALDAVDQTDIFNNTFYATGGSAINDWTIEVADANDGGVETHDNTFRNNVVYAGGQRAYYVTQMSAYDTAAKWAAYCYTDYNCLFGADDVADGTSGSDFNQVDLATWRTVSGSDANTQEADPLLEDAAGGDYTLGVGSPAFDAGIDYKDLLGGGTSAAINQGAYISELQDEVIGIR